MAKIRLTESEMIDLLEEIILFEAMSLDDIHTKYYSDISKEDFDEIVSADPTSKPDKKGKYTEWLLNLYKTGKLKNEDLYKATEYLKAFHKFKNRIQQKDIRSYKSLPELYDVVKPFIDDPDQATSKSDEVRKIKEGAEKVYEDEKWLVIIPHTKEAAIYYGKGTQWCTAATGSYNYFDYYNKDGRLYININKETGEKYQFHFESDQFMNEKDHQVQRPVGQHIDLTPGLLKFYRNNYSRLALPVTSTYESENIDTIKGLDDYCIYYPDATGDQSSIIKYSDEIKDYEVIETLYTPNLYFYGVCLANRFICVRGNGLIVNLYDIVNQTMLFNADDNVFSIDDKFFLEEKLDISKLDYITCKMNKNDDNGSECRRIYSLKEMRFVYTVPEGCRNVIPLMAISRHYKSSLFYSIDENDYKYCTVFDAEHGVICEHAYFSKIRHRYEDPSKINSYVTMRYKPFAFLLVSMSNSPYIFGIDSDKQIIFYDGTQMTWDYYRHNEDKLIKPYIE